jgi:hypothetical protein
MALKYCHMDMPHMYNFCIISNMLPNPNNSKWIKRYWIIRTRVGSLPISLLSSPSQELSDSGVAQLLIIPLRSATRPQQYCWIKQRRILPIETTQRCVICDTDTKVYYCVPTHNKKSYRIQCEWQVRSRRLERVLETLLNEKNSLWPLYECHAYYFIYLKSVGVQRGTKKVIRNAQ